MQIHELILPRPMQIRELILSGKLDELRTLFASVADPELLRNDEVEMAWQELLCTVLERASSANDQPALKEALAQATAHGMLPMEKPVHKALEAFVDPPELIAEPGAEAYPDHLGRVRIEVTVSTG